MNNRRLVETNLATFLDKVVLQPELVRGICENDVNESYTRWLRALHEKLDFLGLNDDERKRAGSSHGREVPSLPVFPFRPST